MAAHPPGSRARVRGLRLGTAVLGAWAAAILIVGAFLMAGHLVSLPAPAMAGERLTTAVAGKAALAKGRWSALHILYDGCGCSSRVLAHLLARGPRSDLQETVIYAGEPGAGGPAAPSGTSTNDQVRRAGFQFEALTPAELEARYQVEAAPIMVIADPRGAVRYVGGYTDRSGAKQINDLAIIDQLESGGAVPALPVFGCAVSRRVQDAIDPLGLKYRKEKSQ